MKKCKNTDSTTIEKEIETLTKRPMFSLQYTTQQIRV